MAAAAMEVDALEVLRATEILRGVSSATLQRIADVAKPQSIDEGETLYSVGDPARSAYVVAAGRVRFILGGDGRPAAQGSVVLAGDILGWAALLGDAAACQDDHAKLSGAECAPRRCHIVHAPEGLPRTL
jgi:CRP-like cAMP-binding protein